MVLGSHVTAGMSVPERLEEELRCDGGPIDQTAAIAHHTAGYSVWATTHAVRLLGVGCGAGPATIYMRFSPHRATVDRALATMRGYGPVCVVEHGLFGGRQLGAGTFDELCEEVGGDVRDL
jgi:hypothetical protein